MTNLEQLAEKNKLYQTLKANAGRLPVGAELPCYFDHNGECLVCPESAWPTDCPFKKDCSTKTMVAEAKQ